jgi:membrane-associated phospholipid phosphatase
MSAIPNSKKSTDEVGAFPSHPTDSTLDHNPTLLEQLNGLDQNLYTAVARSQTPALDEPLRRLSNAANYSRLWLGIAAGLAIFGGRPGRKAALTGIAAVGVASAAANLAVKPLYRRRRPDREAADVPPERQVKMPESTSFPSGHSASAFAFATAVTSQLPVVGAPLITLAGAVAYSRVHTGVHYPGDVLVGSTLGIVAGSITATTFRHLERRHLHQSHP